MHFDPNAEGEHRGKTTDVVDVILICGEFDADVELELRRVGFEITNREHANEGLLYGRVRSADIPALLKIEGIESVTPDTTQYAFYSTVI